MGVGSGESAGCVLGAALGWGVVGSGRAFGTVLGAGVGTGAGAVFSSG